MPDRAIVAYYETVADKIVPFLRGRRVGVRHTFDHTAVFRRHPTSLLQQLRRTSPAARGSWPESNWIYIPNRRTLLEIVRQHGYEFFPHLEGENDVWFALDIDVRTVPVRLGAIVVRTALNILTERKVQYLLTFSGGNGFHVRWSFTPSEVPPKKWQFFRAIVRALREETERRLQESPHRTAFYRHIPRGDPITELNAMDRAAQRSILFDELILKPQATIRAPFSLHMKHRWTTIPLTPKNLDRFVPARDATMAKAGAHAPVRLPKNPMALFRRPPWNL